MNNTEYYKEKITDLNYIIENINDYILFIKANMNNIKEETIYSLNYKYPFNLKEYCSNIFVCLKDNYSVWDRDTSLYEKVDNEFIAFLRYISFDYYIIKYYCVKPLLFSFNKIKKTLFKYSLQSLFLYFK